MHKEGRSKVETALLYESILWQKSEAEAEWWGRLNFGDRKHKQPPCVAKAASLCALARPGSSALMSLPHCSSNYSDFASYLESNTPCIFPRDALCDRWPARKDWHVAHSRPAWDVLLQRYASDTVTVWEQPSGEQNDIPLHDALRLMTTTPETETPSSSIFYIKDWHLALFAERHHLTPFYTVPAVFQDDWMNDYYLSVRDEDFRFVYAGQKGSVTSRSVCGHRSGLVELKRCPFILLQMFIAMCTVPTRGPRTSSDASAGGCWHLSMLLRYGDSPMYALQRCSQIFGRWTTRSFLSSNLLSRASSSSSKRKERPFLYRLDGIIWCST